MYINLEKILSNHLNHFNFGSNNDIPKSPTMTIIKSIIEAHLTNIDPNYAINP